MNHPLVPLSRERRGELAPTEVLEQTLSPAARDEAVRLTGLQSGLGVQLQHISFADVRVRPGV